MFIPRYLVVFVLLAGCATRPPADAQPTMTQKPTPTGTQCARAKKAWLRETERMAVRSFRQIESREFRKRNQALHKSETDLASGRFVNACEQMGADKILKCLQKARPADCKTLREELNGLLWTRKEREHIELRWARLYFETPYGNSSAAIPSKPKSKACSSQTGHAKREEPQDDEFRFTSRQEADCYWETATKLPPDPGRPSRMGFDVTSVTLEGLPLFKTLSWLSPLRGQLLNCSSSTLAAKPQLPLVVVLNFSVNADGSVASHSVKGDDVAFAACIEKALTRFIGPFAPVAPGTQRSAQIPLRLLK